MSSDHTRIHRRLDDIVESDPRISDEHVRLIGGGDAPVVLVGVVHNHPSSIHRVEEIIEELSPATVAVELPALLVPVFRSSKRRDEITGGEMVAAMAAANPSPVVGIDIPSLSTVRALGAELRTQDVRSGTVWRVLRETAQITTQVVLGRLAHAGVPGIPSVADLEYGHEYDLAPDAKPAVQAEHEASHLRRSTALLRTFEPPEASRVMDGVRERTMAAKLGRLRSNGPVVGVVGYGHLDGIEASLQNTSG